MNRTRVAVAVAALTVLTAVGCQSVQTTQGGVVGVDRKQSMTSLVSEKEVEQQAQQEYAQLMAQAQQKGLLNRNPQYVQRVRTVAQRLIPHVNAFRPDALQWKWEANVLTSKDVNAWCMPGGKIAVYTGLIERLGLSDDELAAVMGHEIAHALREHARERIGCQMATETGTAIGAVALEILTGIRLDPTRASPARCRRRSSCCRTAAKRNRKPTASASNSLPARGTTRARP
jgi:Zn-dependent protease with chaperone function